MYEYQLEPYKGRQSRYRCPQCNHASLSFVRYVKVGGRMHLAEHVGRCNREDKCGYHFTPYQYFKETGWGKTALDYLSWDSNFSSRDYAYQPLPTVQAVHTINHTYVNQSFTAYAKNNFVQYLIKRFGNDTAMQLIHRYYIGTSSHWPGATIFWQLDNEQNARTGKVMLYDKENGKRVKEPVTRITWAHTLIQRLERKQGIPYCTPGNPRVFVLRQCLFGEHLLTQTPPNSGTPPPPDTPIAIVESEKTAIIASAIVPNFIWLACGSLNGLSPTKCRVLKGRKVMLFPDVNAHDKWKLKAMELQHHIPEATFMVSGVLERLATEELKTIGGDLADVLG